MSVQGDFGVFEAVSGDVPTEGSTYYQVEETFWGYIVKSVDKPNAVLVAMQATAWFVGILFIVASLGLWLIPFSSFAAGVIGMKVGATVVSLACAAFCLWFASRGSDCEIQIDTRMGEVREVIRNHAGRATLMGRYGFDAIGSVFIDLEGRSQRRSDCMGALVLRYRNTAQTLHVATGALGELGPLRDRLGRDLMIAPQKPDPVPVPTPTPTHYGFGVA